MTDPISTEEKKQLKEQQKLQKQKEKEAKLAEKKALKDQEKENKAHKKKNLTLEKETTPDSPDSVKSAPEESPAAKTFFGIEKKTPRAEIRAAFQVEIESLKVIIAQKDEEIAAKDEQLAQVQTWIRSAPVQ